MRSNYRPVVLLSGGVDSATALAYAIDGPDVVDALAVFADYGQRHQIERRAAERIASHFGVPLTVLDLTGYGASVVSALTGHSPIPHGHYESDAMASTVVPNRNAVLIAAAAGIAASHGMTDVITAVHAGDHAIYPDCRPDFLRATDQATRLGCGVAVRAPFKHRDKATIVRLGAKLGVPYAHTWSCYEGDPAGHCGRCGACVERAEAFHRADIADPVDYRDRGFWRHASDAVLLQPDRQPQGA